MKILEYVQAHSRHFEWRALLRLLKKLPGLRLYFKASSAMGFAAREIESIHVHDDVVEITCNFLGLQGAATPLPLHFSEFIVQDDPDDSTLHDFFNFFNHQFYRALMRIDEKYAFVAQVRSQFDDVLSQGLLGLIGLWPGSKQDQKIFYTQLFLGLRYFVAGRVSRQGLCLYLKRIYDLDHVEVRELVVREIFVPLVTQSAVGLQNVILGESMLLGSRCYCASLHLEVHIFVERMDRFFPETEAFSALRKQLEFILPNPFFVTLVVHARCVPLFVFDVSYAVRLGYNSVLSLNEEYLCSVRFTFDY